MARERKKSKFRTTRTLRKRRPVAATSKTTVQIPLQARAAFANYLLHGLTPDQARMCVAEDIAEVVDAPHLAGG